MSKLSLFLLSLVLSIANADANSGPGIDTVTDADPDKKGSLVYSGDGIVFEHKPANFMSKFRFRIQNRFTYETEDRDKLKAESIDFAVRRLRLRYDGHALDPRLLFRLQLSFTRGDMDYDRTVFPNVLRDAAVGWRLTDRTTLWYGQTKLPGNRQRIVSSGAQQFVDRSLLNATFNIDRDLGGQIHHRFGGAKPVLLKLAISNGEGRATENKDNGLAYTARLEWLPLGSFKDDGDYFESDLAREISPKISIGGVYSLNKKTTRSGGQIGRQFNTAGLHRDLETWFADFILKYRGYSFSSEYAKRSTTDPVFTDGTSQVTIYKGQALNLQSGYLMDSNFEVSMRFTQLWAAAETLLGDNDRRQYTVALSKYLTGHKVKFQTDLTLDSQENRLSALQQSSWIYRAQIELGI
jgi:phosphate-selective porin OprO and OprP